VVGPLLRRGLRVLWLLAVLTALGFWVLSGGPLVALLMWVVFAYLVSRAAAGIGSDVQRLRGLGAGRRLNVRGWRRRGRGADTL
jgi:hypothetical protein